MEKLRERINKKAGFTLVELLVVIAIIAILSVTAFISLGGETIKARDSKRKEDLALIQNAMEIVFINEAAYPDEPLTVGSGAGEIKKQYLSEVPVDPKGDPYVYAKSGATYLVVATLENTGVTAEYTAYMIGNGEDLFGAASGIDGSTCGGAETTCDLDTGGNCIPYCP